MSGDAITGMREVRYGDVDVLMPVGRIDQDTSAGFQSHLLERLGAGVEPARALVLDVRDVEYISSFGLRALMIGKKKGDDVGCRLVVACPTSVVREVLSISRLDRTIDTFSDLRSALAAVSDSAANDYDRSQGGAPAS